MAARVVTRRTSSRNREDVPPPLQTAASPAVSSPAPLPPAATSSSVGSAGSAASAPSFQAAPTATAAVGSPPAARQHDASLAELAGSMAWILLGCCANAVFLEAMIKYEVEAIETRARMATRGGGGGSGRESGSVGTRPNEVGRDKGQGRTDGDRRGREGSVYGRAQRPSAPSLRSPYFPSSLACSRPRSLVPALARLFPPSLACSRPRSLVPALPPPLPPALDRSRVCVGCVATGRRRT